MKKVDKAITKIADETLKKEEGVEQEVITIEEDVTIGDVILEKGDKIRVLDEKYDPWSDIEDWILEKLNISLEEFGDKFGGGDFSMARELITPIWQGYYSGKRPHNVIQKEVLTLPWWKNKNPDISMKNLQLLADLIWEWTEEVWGDS
jgi:hypothetical protein